MSEFSLKSALSDIHAAQALEPTDSPKSKAKASPKHMARLETPLVQAKTVGKSSNEDYGALKVYVRKDTRRKAERKWEDEGGGDLSDLVEHLFSQYVGS